MSNIMTIYRVSKPISVLLAVLERLSDRARSNTSAQRTDKSYWWSCQGFLPLLAFAVKLHFLTINLFSNIELRHACSSVEKYHLDSITKPYHQPILVATHELDRRSAQISGQIQPKVRRYLYYAAGWHGILRGH